MPMDNGAGAHAGHAREGIGEGGARGESASVSGRGRRRGSGGGGSNGVNHVGGQGGRA